MIIKRIYTAILFSTILFALIGLVIRFVPLAGDYGGHKILIDIKDNLLKNTKSPKIILVGGSNVIFGVDSELIEYETGYKVVNMAVNMNYGINIYLGLIEKYALNGDVVVLLPEYDVYSKDLSYLYRLIRLYPEAVQYFDFPEDYSVNSFINWISTIGVMYFEDIPENSLSTGLNKYGDLVMANRIVNKQKLDCNLSNPDLISAKHTFDRLNDFSSSVKNKGINVVFGFPVLMQDCYTEDRKIVLTSFYDFVRKNIKFPVVGTPERYLFERSLILDTIYHVNLYGKEIRTKKLIEDISPFLDEDILAKHLLFKKGNSFQNVLIEDKVPEVMKINEKIDQKIKLTNKGFAILDYLQGYFVKVFDYKYIDSINFGLAGNSKPYQSSGWSDPEDGFNWTNGESTTISIQSDAIDSDVTIEADIWPFLPTSDTKSQIVNIYVGDNFIGSWNVDSHAFHKLTIPKKYVLNSKLELQFKFPNAVSPSKFGSVDQRILAVAFKQIKLNFPLQMPQSTTLEFDKNIELNTGDSYEFDLPIVAPAKPGIYHRKIEFYQMDNLIPSNTVDENIQIVQ